MTNYLNAPLSYFLLSTMSLKAFLINNRRMVSGLGFAGLAPILFSSLVTALLIHQQNYFQSLTLVQWLPFFLLSALTMALAITPTTFIALVGGFFLGWQAALPMISAYLAASSLGYAAGKKLDNGRLLASFPEAGRFHQMLNALQGQDWLIMILVRISPLLPFSLINLLLPASGIRFSVFIGAGFIGMLPRTLFSIWMGLEAKNLLQLLQSPDSNSSSILWMTLTVIISMGGLLFVFLRLSNHLDQCSPK